MIIDQLFFNNGTWQWLILKSQYIKQNPILPSDFFKFWLQPQVFHGQPHKWFNLVLFLSPFKALEWRLFNYNYKSSCNVIWTWMELHFTFLLLCCIFHSSNKLLYFCDRQQVIYQNTNSKEKALPHKILKIFIKSRIYSGIHNEFTNLNWSFQSNKWLPRFFFMFYPLFWNKPHHLHIAII